MNSKLDSFNKDKVKCDECKKYFDINHSHNWLQIKNKTGNFCQDCYDADLNIGYFKKVKQKIKNEQKT